MNNKQILMVMPMLKGGGAESVAAILTNEFYKNGYTCEMLLTSSDEDEVIRRDLNDNIPIIILRDFFKKSLKDLVFNFFRVITSFLCKPFEKLKWDVPCFFAYLSFIANYYKELDALKTVLKERKDAVVIAFLQPSIPLVLLASRGLDNKIVISERCDPYRLMKHRYGYNFMKKYYQRADRVVFQTTDAKKAYPGNIAVKGTVIFNPIKDNLPEAYSGDRNKNITTFCRISYQKNLPVLVKAFSIVHGKCPDYRLRIIGNTQNEDDEKALKETTALIEELKLSDFIDFEPFSLNVHEKIIKDAVYVNSSDYEGMSNAMLESMAIGLPVVCTDCPIGGAASIIKNNENGVLAALGNADELANGIMKVIGDADFSQRISGNAVEIRESLSLENVAKEWMDLL